MHQDANGIKPASPDAEARAQPTDPALTKYDSEAQAPSPPPTGTSPDRRDSGSRRSRPAPPAQQIAPSQPHGLADGSAQHPAIPSGLPRPDLESHIHPDLRALTAYYASAPEMMQPGASAPHAAPIPIAAAPSGSPIGAHDEHGDPMALDSMFEGRRAKRELSQSKRAAQNRAAQRAFRQRKEGYIKKLEQQVKDYEQMETGFKSLQSEYHIMREYVIHLQSRLLEAKGEYPTPPPGVNLGPPQGYPTGGNSIHSHQPDDSAGQAPLPPSANPLAEVAQAVAQLHQRPEASSEDSRTAEALTRQIRADGLP